MAVKIKNVFLNDRNRVLLGNIGGTIVIKGFSVLVSLLATPAYIVYFSDNAILGVWYTLVAALNWILTFDFGIGNGLRNNLAVALSKKDNIRAKRLVSTAYLVIAALTVVAILIGAAAIMTGDWASLLNYEGAAVNPDALKLSVLIVFIGTMIQFFLKLLTSVLFALQKTALNNLLFLTGNIALLVYLLLSRPDNASSALLGLSVAQITAINIPLLVGTIWFFAGQGRSFAPSIGFWDKSAVQDVLGLGSVFFVIQIAFLFMNSTNEYLISILYGSAPVVDYQVYYKCFFLIITVFTLAVQPVWSAMTVAIAERRFSWVKKVYSVFNLGALAATVTAALLAALFPAIVSVWLGANAIDTPSSVGVVFVLLVGVTLFVNSSTCVANASNRLKTQLVFSIVGAILKIALSFAFAALGLPWYFVVFANFLALVPLLAVQVISNVRYLSSVQVD